MNKKRKTIGMAKKALAVAMAAAMVVTSMPVSQAAAAPAAYGSTSLNLIRYSQKTNQGVVRTLRLRNTSTRLYTIKWTTSNRNIARLSGRTNLTSVKLAHYYRPGSAIVRATVTKKGTRRVIRRINYRISTYQGATNVQILNSKNQSIKGKTTTVALKSTVKIAKKMYPNNVNYTPQKLTYFKAFTAAQKLIGSVNASGVFTPNRASMVGRGDKNVTVTVQGNGQKGARKLSGTTVVRVQGGQFVVDQAIDSKDLTFQVGVTVPTDATYLKGTSITLTGKAGTDAAGKTVKANYVGLMGEKAIYKVADQMLKGTGEYNGTYEISSFVSGALYANGQKELTFKEDLTQNAVKVNSNSANIDDRNYTFVLNFATDQNSVLAASALKDVKVQLMNVDSGKTLNAEFSQVMSATPGAVQFKMTSDTNMKPGDGSLNGSYIMSLYGVQSTFANVSAMTMKYVEDTNVYVSAFGDMNNETFTFDATLANDSVAKLASGSSVTLTASTSAVAIAPLTAVAVVSGNALSYKLDGPSQLTLESALRTATGAAASAVFKAAVSDADIQVANNVVNYTRKLSNNTKLASITVPNGGTKALTDQADQTVEFATGADVSTTTAINVVAVDDRTKVEVTPAQGTVTANAITVTATAEDGTKATYKLTLKVFESLAQEDQEMVNRAKAAVDAANFTTTSTAINSEAAAKASIDAVMATLALNGATYTISGSAFVAPIAGTQATPAGVNGSYVFNIMLSKGSATASSIAFPLTFQAAPWVDPVAADKAAVDASAAKIVAEKYETNAVLTTTDAAIAAIASKIAGLGLESGVTANVTAAGVLVPAQQGTAMDFDGTDGSFSFQVVVAKNAATVTTQAIQMVIKATEYPLLTQYKADIAAAKAGMEAEAAQYSEYSSANANTQVSMANFIESVALAYADEETAIDATILKFTAAEDGSFTAPMGKDGQVSFTVKFVKYVGSEEISAVTKTLVYTIKAVPDYAAANQVLVNEVRDIIQATSAAFVVPSSAVANVTQAETAAQAIVDSIALDAKYDGVTATVSATTGAASLKFAEDGTNEVPTGTNGAFTFVVNVMAGIDETAARTATKDMSMVITATEYPALTQNKADLATAMENISTPQAFTLASSVATASDAALAEVKGQIETQVSGYANPVVTVTAVSFAAATDGTETATAGANGKFVFNVDVALGTEGSLVTAKANGLEAIIEAKEFVNDPQLAADQAAVDEVMALVNGFATTLTTVEAAQAATKEAAETEAINQIVALIDENATGTSVTLSSVVFTEAVTATQANPEGTDGSLTFNVDITKGNAKATSTNQFTLPINAEVPANLADDIAAVEGAVATVAAIVVGSVDSSQASDIDEAVATAQTLLRTEAAKDADLNGLTLTVSSQAFTEAVDGTAGTPNGTNGELQFVVVIERPLAKATTETNTVMDITAAQYDVDQATVNAVKTEVETLQNSDFSLDYNTTTTQDAIDTAEGLLNGLMSGKEQSTDITIQKSTATFAPSEKADQANPNGIDGLFTFKVEVALNGKTAVSDTVFEVVVTAEQVADLPENVAIVNTTLGEVELLEAGLTEVGSNTISSEQDAINAALSQISVTNEGAAVLTASDVNYDAAEDAVAATPTGTNGSISLKVVVTKGAGDAEATLTSTKVFRMAITATVPAELTTNIDNMDAAKTALTEANAALIAELELTADNISDDASVITALTARVTKALDDAGVSGVSFTVVQDGDYVPSGSGTAGSMEFKITLEADAGGTANLILTDEITGLTATIEAGVVE